MSERLSALMDAEVSETDTAGLIESLAGDEELAERWGTYHLIGDALRGTAPAAFDRAAFRARLDSEPAIVAIPARSRKPALVVRNTVSIAAGLAAIAFVGWVAMPAFQPVQPASRSASVEMPAAKVIPAAVIPAAHGVEDYLLAHQRFSPSFAIQGAVPYVRLVSEEGKEPRR